eukprot:gb/GFBE01042605.1/.p1 GENE.gb/GFBE01042605.1/~~gb/GFBE01042605.1/.p1  ORF type:complete len:580 (+),score=125.28 gb/GFBE01042605.1/:1-1740(+)
MHSDPVLPVEIGDDVGQDRVLQASSKDGRQRSCSTESFRSGNDAETSKPRDSVVGLSQMRAAGQATQVLADAKDDERALMSGGFAAKIASNQCFQNVTLLVICINAIWIFVDVEWNHSNLRDANGKLPLEPFSTVVENLFCSYFVVEVLIRFFAFQKVTNCCRDRWYMFDVVLVLFMVIETWVMPLIRFLATTEGDEQLSNFSALRLLRLLRLTRMARIMRFFPELMTLVKGMVRAMESVFFVLLFLILVVYIFAIIFTSQLGTPGYVPPPDLDDPDAKMLFADLGSSMMTLFTYGVLGDNLYYWLTTILAENILLFWAAILFVMMSGITLLNMLIGVLCQVIDDSSKEEAELRRMADMKECLEKAFKAADTDGDGFVDEGEWEAMGGNPRVMDAILQLGADQGEAYIIERLEHLQETIFSETSCLWEDEQRRALRFHDFADQVIGLRSDAQATALDVEMLKNTVTKEDKSLVRRLERLEPVLRKLLGAPEMEKVSSPGASARNPLSFSLPGQIGSEKELSPVMARRAFLQEVPTELLIYVLKSRVIPETQTTPANCLRCGTAHTPDAEFCHRCGEKRA